MEKIRTILKENRTEVFFICCSILFGALFGFAVIAYDDAYNMPLIGETIKEEVLYNLATYKSWTSRIFINTVWSIILEHGYVFFMVYMGISMYVLLKGFYLLFAGENDYEAAVFAAFCAMLFPFHLLTSAGWIATTGTYFGPQAFGIMALVPIKRAYDNKKLSIKEMIWFSLCLIYGANFEQMCIMLLFLYVVYTVCMIAEKNIRWQVLWFFFLSIASMAFFLTCPGNWSRSDTENRYFPTYGMLNFVDKVELATTRTLKWIFIDGTLVTIVFLAILAFVVIKKYKNHGYRLIASLPLAIALLLGPFNDNTKYILPKITKLNTDVGYYGSINVGARGLGIGLLQVFTFLVLSLLVLICLFLINDTIFGLVMDIALVLVGVGTGAMMGFTATIYASSGRTYSTLVFCVMLLILHTFYNNRRYFEFKRFDLVYAGYGAIAISFINLAALIMTQFY